MTMTPDEWLADFQSKVANMQREAASFRRNLESAGERVTSEDGKFSVSVAPNGALLGLRIDDSAVTGTGAELAGRIMELVRAAREGSAQHVVDSFRPVVGNAADELDMDVSVPAEPDEATPGQASVHREQDWNDEDFSADSIFHNGDTAR